MFKHVIRHLSAYHHGELPPDEKLRVEEHLRTCAKCRAAHEEIRFGARLAGTLSVTESGAIPLLLKEGRLRGTRSRGGFGDVTTPAARFARVHPSFKRRGIIGALVAATVLLVVFVGYRAPHGPSWEVTGLPGTARLRPGEALQTDSSSQALIKIANIGQLTVDPNTKVRLLVTHANEHRIALDRGKVEASTWAPPRLFIVETPSANAIDLGCKYTLEVEEDGGSILHVTLGLVALDRGGRETIVPAGAFCRTRSATGPGTPFFEDSSGQFQSALSKVDSLPEGPQRANQLAIVLREAHVRDALSLWHLIPRLDPESRGLIYDSLAQILPPPPQVTRDGIVSLDPTMLDAWRQIVSQLWQ